MELMGLWDYLWPYCPIGIIGLWRWIVWLFKKLCASRYEPISPDENFVNHCALSIVVPVYNENPEVFKKALNSWQNNNPDEIIAVIDKADGECVEIFKNFARENPSAILIVTETPGKRPALARGITEAKSEFVVLVDSDTIWADNVRKNGLAPFIDANIGGVVAKQNVIDSSKILQKMTDILWDLRNSNEWPSQIAMGRAVTCLSGRTAFYRRKILIPNLDEFLNEILFGRKKESGDDKCFTRITQRNNWNTYFQDNAQVYSSATSDFKTFWKQRTRWTRNTINSDLASLFIEKWAWKHPYLAWYMIDRFISPFCLLIAPICFGIALYLGHWPIAVILIVWWALSRGIKIIPHLKRKPKDVLILPAYIAINFLTAVIKIYATVTMRHQKWIRGMERETKKSKLGKIVTSVISATITTIIISGMAILVILGII